MLGWTIAETGVAEERRAAGVNRNPSCRGPAIGGQLGLRRSDGLLGLRTAIGGQLGLRRSDGLLGLRTAIGGQLGLRRSDAKDPLKDGLTSTSGFC